MKKTLSQEDLQSLIDEAVEKKLTALSLSKKVPNDTYKNEDSDIKENENDIKKEEEIEIEDNSIKKEEENNVPNDKKIDTPTDTTEVEKLKVENEMLKKENEKWDKLFNSYSKENKKEIPSREGWGEK